ncbi:MAG: hypothetical protein Q8T08_01515 [Ignavibacteria bacterium]|nr:hypothetical protein [Ignavibacteria bacterium]
MKQKENELSIEQFISCIEEIYLHSLQKDSSHMDKEFAEWWVDLATD